MSGPAIVEYIDPALKELMERFFELTAQDVEAMRVALEAKDFKALTRLGHTIKGTGYGYGFMGMGDIGRALELASKDNDLARAAVEIERFVQYLDTVTVEFTE